MRFLVVAIALAALFACTNSSCPTGDLPSCPDAGAPSFASDVAPIIAASCTSCHSPSGVESSRPLLTWDQVFAERGAALDQVYACQMPQSGSLSPADRKTLLTWLVCGAPDN